MGEKLESAVTTVDAKIVESHNLQSEQLGLLQLVQVVRSQSQLFSGRICSFLTYYRFQGDEFGVGNARTRMYFSVIMSTGVTVFLAGYHTVEKMMHSVAESVKIFLT